MSSHLAVKAERRAAKRLRNDFVFRPEGRTKPTPEKKLKRPLTKGGEADKVVFDDI